MTSTLATETVPLTDLNLYHRNPRQGDIGILVQSLQKFGQYKHVVVNRGTHTGRPNEIAAGNHTVKAMQQLGWDTAEVSFIDVDEDTLTRIVTVDNRSSDLATYDDHVLSELLMELQATSDDGLEATGYDTDDLDRLLDNLYPGNTFEQDEDGKYVRKVESPIYEPTGPMPPVTDLIDDTKTVELRDQIHDADLPDDVRDFLLAAAARHDVFHFDRIAEYYAHAPANVQRLMEQSALVIIDFDQAIELGYIQLNDDTLAAFSDEYPNA